MHVFEAFIPAVLRERAANQPDAPAFTFIDFEVDPTGFAETLTWAQLYRRVQVVAAELAPCGSPGDRVAILAPQGLEYIVGFLGAMEAGFIAVPLSVPQLGVHDERASAVIRDSAPVAIVTTSAVVSDVVAAASGSLNRSAAAVIEVDALDLDAATIPSYRSVYTKTALLQYTSGSTRRPAGVTVTHKNIIANIEQVMSDYFEDHGGLAPSDTTLVSWLPFYHDMGLLLGISAPITTGLHAVLMSPMAFLQKPARWIQLLARSSNPFSAAPNFAFELAARRTSDDDMAGLSLAHVQGIISGSERVHPATLRRFNERFSRFGLSESVLRPSYGLAEATLYVASPPPGQPATTACFDYEKLSAGHAMRCDNGGGSELVSYGPLRASTVRIVDPDTGIENPAGKVGEIWVYGDNVATGYWRNPQATQKTFGAKIVEPSAGTPQGPWLRTGDLGVMSDDELFIVGRIKDLLIVDGRNHYPDDIEATIQEVTRTRSVAVSVADDHSERLVAIVEIRTPSHTGDEFAHSIQAVRREVTSAISRSHNVRVADVVLVPRGSIPLTTSGKVRRSTCADEYLAGAFTRLDHIS